MNVIQSVRGAGDEYPIMHWVPSIKVMQLKRVPVIVNLDPSDVEDFLDAMNPHGFFLWVATEGEQEELAILRRIQAWQ